MSKTRNILSAVAIAVITATSFDTASAAMVHPSKTKAASIVAEEATKHGVPVQFALAIARVESGMKCNARGGSALGVMQITLSTARSMGYKGKASGLLDCRNSARFGVKYLKLALKYAGGNTCHAAGLYNTGVGAKKLSKAGRSYCAKVLRTSKK